MISEKNHNKKIALWNGTLTTVSVLGSLSLAMLAAMNQDLILGTLAAVHAWQAGWRIRMLSLSSKEKKVA